MAKKKPLEKREIEEAVYGQANVRLKKQLKEAGDLIESLQKRLDNERAEAEKEYFLRQKVERELNMEQCTKEALVIGFHAYQQLKG